MSPELDEKYRLKARAESLGLDGEYTGYHLILKKGREVIFEGFPDNIVDLGILVIKVLQEQAKPPVEVKTEGCFYKFGDGLIKKIVGLYNSHQTS